MYLTLPYLLSQDNPIKVQHVPTYREGFQFFGIVSKKVEDRRKKEKEKEKEVGRLGF